MLNFQRFKSAFNLVLVKLRILLTTFIQCFEHAECITGGNVVRGDRTVMQMKSLRDHPDMSYGSNKQWNQLCE